MSNESMGVPAFVDEGFTLEKLTELQGWMNEYTPLPGLDLEAMTEELKRIGKLRMPKMEAN